MKTSNEDIQTIQKIASNIIITDTNGDVGLWYLQTEDTGKNETYYHH